MLENEPVMEDAPVVETPAKADAPEEKAPEEAAHAVRTRKGPLTAEEMDDLVADMTVMLKVPKTRDAIMVFSMYTVSEFNRKYFLLDVDGTAYRRAWNLFKERTGTTDAVTFLEIVYRILNTDMPRLHRAVDWVPLN